MKHKSFKFFILSAIVYSGLQNYTTCAYDDIVDRECKLKKGNLWWEEVSEGCETLKGIPTVICGICTRTWYHSSTTSNRCLHRIFWNRYIVHLIDQNQVCVINIIHCKAQFFAPTPPDCSQHGVCSEGFSTYKCFCHSPWFGRNCEIKGSSLTENAYVKGVDVFFNKRVRVTQELPVLVATASSGENIEVEITVSLEKYEMLLKKTLKIPVATNRNRDQLVQFCQKNTDLNYYPACATFAGFSSELYSTKIRFPLKRVLSSNTKGVFYYGDSESFDWPIGYISFIQVNVFNTPKVTNKRQLAYSDSYYVWVDYPLETMCYRNVHISSCESGNRIEKIYTTETKLLIGTFPKDTMPEPNVPGKLKCFEKTRYWRMWQDLPDGSSKLISEVFGQRNVILKRQTLAAGSYRVEYNRPVLTKYDKRENFAICSIEVQSVPLIAIIRGGSEISVSGEVETKLDGSKSYNPNVVEQLNRKGLTYTWSCEILSSLEPCLEDLLSPSKIGTYSSIVNIPSFSLKTSTRYKITLIVSKKGLKSASATQVINVGAEVPSNASIIVTSVHLECTNCYMLRGQMYADPKSYISLRATVTLSKKSKNLTDSDFLWDYSEDEGKSYVSTISISVQGTSGDFLKIKENKLKEGNIYYFRVKISGSDLFAESNIIMDKLEDYACEIDPKSGIVGVTLFSINCFNLNESSEFVVYEVYDRAEAETSLYFSGRMLGTRKINKTIDNFRLANGKVVVLLYTSYKVIRSFVIDVKLTPFTGTEQDILLIDHIDRSLQQNKNEEALRTASVIPFVISTRKPSMIVIKKLFLSIYNVNSILPFIDITENIKLGLSSFTFSLDSILIIFKEVILEPDTIKKCASVLLSLAKMLHSKLTKGLENEITLNPSVIKDMLGQMLNSVEILLRIKIDQFMYRPLYLINYILLETVQSTSQQLVGVLYQTGNTLLWQQEPGDEASKIVSKRRHIFSWVQVKKNISLDFILDFNNRSNLYMRLSEEFYISQSNFTLGTHITILKINPFWWGYNNINTDIILLEMCHFQVEKSQKCNTIHPHKHYVHFYFDIENQVRSLPFIEGSSTQLDPSKDTFELDLELPVYKIDPPIKADLFIRFFEFKEGDNLRVLVTENLRPDYKMMISDSNTRVISKSSPEYSLGHERTERDRTFYMGVLPGKNIPVGNVMKFKFKVHYTLCKTWLEFNYGSFGCSVGNITNDTILQCDSDHLSLFGGQVDLPIIFLNPPIDFYLFLTSYDNWIPVMLLAVVLLIMTLMFIWGWLRDKKDKNKGVVIVLEDNYPGERFAYLLGVYTGSRLHSSTNANVGVRLFGDMNNSRPHILKSSLSKTLQSNSDDWFLIYYPQPLGNLENLQIWHDNSGKNPDWFVERILIFDLSKKCQYTFEINVWLTLELYENPEVLVAPTTIEELFSVSKVFQENFISGMRDTHYWTSVLWKHPRNPISRTKRIAVLLCFILQAMGVSLIFYLYFYGFIQEDNPAFSLGKTDLIIFFIVYFVASFAAGLGMFLFRRSFKHVYTRNVSSVFMRPEVQSKKSSFLPSEKGTSNYFNLAETLSEERRTRVMTQSRKTLYQKVYKLFSPTAQIKKRTTYQHFADAIYNMARGSTLEPVRLLRQSSLKNIWPILISAYIVCSFFIVLPVIVVIIFGFKLPYIKCEIWLTIFLLVVLLHLIVVSNVKVLLFSAALSFDFQRIVPLTNYRLQPSEGMRKHLVGDEEYLYKLLSMRAKPIYCPLDEKTKLKYRIERIRIMRWKLFIDFVAVLILITVLVMMTTSPYNYHFYTNDHSTSLLIQDHYVKLPSFKDILNLTDLQNFLSYDLQRQLYKSLWYNDDALGYNYSNEAIFWTDDNVVKLLGSARIRQVRVEVGKCPTIRGITISELCSHPWSPNTEVKDVFNVGWIHGSHEDTERKSAAWRYTDAKYSNSSSCYGPSRTFYDAGGYIEDIGNTREQAVVSISLLKADGWLDHATRAVFLELNLYNANTKLFSQVLLVAEKIPSGQLLTAAIVNSINWNWNFNGWNISFVLILLFFFIRTCALMNRNGFFEYSSKLLNVFEGLLLILGILTVIFYTIHKLMCSAYVNEYHKSGTRQFFDFSDIIYYRYLTRVVFSILFIFVIIRLLISWRFGRIYFTFFYTTLLCWPRLVQLTLLFILYLAVIWRMIGYWANVFTFAFFTTAIVHRMDFITSRGAINHHQSIAFLMCLLSFLVTLSFIASFSYYYKVAKVYKIIATDKLNFCTFLKQEAKRKFKKQ